MGKWFGMIKARGDVISGVLGKASWIDRSPRKVSEMKKPGIQVASSFLNDHVQMKGAFTLAT